MVATEIGTAATPADVLRQRERQTESTTEEDAEREGVQTGHRIARRGAQEHTCARTTLVSQKGPLGIIDGWEQLHVSEFPLDSR